MVGQSVFSFSKGEKVIAWALAGISFLLHSLTNLAGGYGLFQG